MGLQMTIPFTVSENGSVSTETDTEIQIQQRVRALVGTELGQRPMRAAMGLPLARLLFGITDTLVTAELRDAVTTQLNSYEPGLNVLSVTTDSKETNDGKSQINVNYSPIFAASATTAVANTAVIEVGGTVKEITVNGNS